MEELTYARVDRAMLYTYYTVDYDVIQVWIHLGRLTGLE